MALADNDLLIVQKPATKVHYKVKIGDLSSEIGYHVPTLTNPPSGAENGDLYWDKDSGTLFIYFNDGVNPNWVPATPVPEGSGGSELTEIDGGTY